MTPSEIATAAKELPTVDEIRQWRETINMLVEHGDGTMTIDGFEFRRYLKAASVAIASAKLAAEREGEIETLRETLANRVLDLRSQLAEREGEVERLRAAIRGVLAGKWSLTGLQEVLGDLNDPRPVRQEVRDDYLP